MKNLNHYSLSDFLIGDGRELRKRVETRADLLGFSVSKEFNMSNTNSVQLFCNLFSSMGLTCDRDTESVSVIHNANGDIARILVFYDSDSDLVAFNVEVGIIIRPMFSVEVLKYLNHINSFNPFGTFVLIEENWSVGYSTCYRGDIELLTDSARADLLDDLKGLAIAQRKTIENVGDGSLSAFDAKLLYDTIAKT